MGRTVPVYSRSTLNVISDIVTLRPDFLLVDLREIFSGLGSGERKKVKKKNNKIKKSSENDHLTGHFQSRFFCLFFFFTFSERVYYFFKYLQNKQLN